MPVNSHRVLIDRACRRIDSTDTAPDLATLAREAGLSPGHFQRLFKTAVGVSPKRYALARRRERLAASLRTAQSVTDAIYDAGYAASSAAYRDSRAFGLPPRRMRSGAPDEEIRHALARTSLGTILVAATVRGICAVEFGRRGALLTALRQRFPAARIGPADRELATWMKRVVAAIDDGSTDAGLPLDIRGTAFQARVWQALTRLRAGQTISYGELARQLGMPQGARAVANACASNGIAVLVPCHRVVASDGGLAGYKWGIQRKRRLLRTEQAASTEARQIR